MRTALLSCIVFLAIFGLNLATLSPAVHPDDSPETVTAAVTLSIQHPPGYPLHSLLGRLAVLSLPGSAAFRVNLISALLGALGVLLFAHVFRLLGSDLLGRELLLEWALLPAVVLAVSVSLWFQSSIAKGGIYTLNFALTEATLLALLLWREGRIQAKGGLLAALFFGLGMANHWTSQVVLLPGYGLLLLEIWWRQGRPPLARFKWQILWAAFFGSCGLTLYLFLPLRTRLLPVMSWGEPWTLPGFLWVVNRSQYAAIESGKTLTAFLALATRALGDLEGDFHWIGLAVILGGWVLFFRRRPILAGALLAMPLALVLAVCLKANPPADSLWIIDPYLLPASSGLLLGLAGWMLWSPVWISGLLALGAFGLGLWHFPSADQSNNFLAYDYANNLFLSCPKDSILFCEGDSNTALPIYARYVLNERHDISPVIWVLSGYPWYIKTLAHDNPGLNVPPNPSDPGGNLRWMATANAARPVILTNSYTKEWVDPTRVVPRGLVNVLLNKGPVTLKEIDGNRIWEAYEFRGVFAPALAMDPLTVRLIRDNYKETPARLAYALQAAGNNAGAAVEFADVGELIAGWAAPWIQAGNCAFFDHKVEEAGAYWKRALAEQPQDPEALANMGLYYFQIKDYDQSLSYARQALERDPQLPAAKEILEKSLVMINNTKPASAPVDAGTAWAARGDQYAQKGMAQQALHAYDEALKLGFVNVNVYRNRAVMQSKLNHSAEAVADLSKAVALSPQDAQLHKYLGILKFNAGDHSGALTELLESQRLNPKDVDLPSLIAQVRAGLKH